MVKKSIMFLVLVCFMTSFVYAAQIEVTTAPYQEVFVTLYKSTPLQDGEKVSGEADKNGKFVANLDVSQSTFDVFVSIRWAKETKAHERFDGLSSSELNEIELYPHGYIPKNNVVVDVPVVEDPDVTEDVDDEQSEEDAVDATLGEGDSAPATGIAGNVISENLGKISSKTYYIFGGVILVGLALFLLMRSSIGRDAAFRNYKKLSKGEIDKEFADAKSKISDAERELEEVKKKEKIMDMENKLKKQMEELNNLKKGNSTQPDSSNQDNLS